MGFATTTPGGCAASRAAILAYYYLKTMGLVVKWNVSRPVLSIGS
jgi:hypothetical protein